MLQKWLGNDQTIDLGQWAMCMGLRKAYLDTLPDRRWAGHLVVLDEGRQPEELLRVTLDRGLVRLRFLPPDLLKIAGAPPADDLLALAARVAAASPPDPPSLFTVLMDRQAVGDMLVAAVADAKRAEVFRARLAAGYGRHWAVHAITPVGHEWVQRILKNGLDLPFAQRAKPRENPILIFHRDGAPATRGGTRFADGQFHLLASEELISVPGATWVDERFVGESIELVDQLLRQPQKYNPLTLYGELNGLLKRNYLRLPGNKSVPLLRLLPDLLKAQWFKSKPPSSSSLPPLPPPAHLTLALYFQIDGMSRADDPGEPTAQQYRPLLEMLEKHPLVKATVGWTEAALRELTLAAPDLLAAYRAGVERKQFETVCALDTPPFPMVAAPDLIRIRVQSWESTAARQAQLWARGIAPLHAQLSTGWAEALRGQNVQYLALAETSLRRIYPEFDPTRPLSVEGWPVVGLSRELSQVLRLGLENSLLDDYLRYLAADYAGRTLAVAVNAGDVSDLGWLDPFLAQAELQGRTFVLLSELANAHAQGAANISPDFAGLEEWTSSEASRARNAAFSRVWNCRKDVHALGEQVQIVNHERSLEEELQRLAFDLLSRGRGQTNPAAPEPDPAGHGMPQVEGALAEAQTVTKQWMLRLGPSHTLPERALGFIRVFEPQDMDHKSNLLTVHLPLDGEVIPETVDFLERGMSVPAQWLGFKGVEAHYLLAVDIPANGYKDLIVIPERLSPAPEGLDMTPHRLCNPWLAVLLDAKGQVTSFRFQGKERLCGPGNQVRGYLLEENKWLRSDLAEARITVTSPGPVHGTVTIHQVLEGGVELTRHLHLGLFNPLLECVTELVFPRPVVFGGKLVVGEFDIVGEQVSWSLPLRAGSTSCAAGDVPPVIFVPQDAIDVQTEWEGLRYTAHQATTRTFQYTARPVAGGVQLGLIASMPVRQPDPTCLGRRSGLGFPGHTYAGRYTYRYALQPLSLDVGARTAFYNAPLLWAFYPKRG